MGGQPFKATDTLHLPEGDTSRSLLVTKWRYIVSNIVLINQAGAEVPLTGFAQIVNALDGNCTTELQIPVPSGEYRGLRFWVGLDSVTNHQDVTTLDQNDPLNDPDMHWSWSPEAGYKFLFLEGRLNTTATGNGPAVGKLEYHIATDANYRVVQTLVNQPFAVAPQGSSALVLQVELAKLFRDINLHTEGFTMTSGSPDKLALAKRLADNIPSMFEVVNQPIAQ
jgi:hypothetical protein